MRYSLLFAALAATVAARPQVTAVLTPSSPAPSSCSSSYSGTFEISVVNVTGTTATKFKRQASGTLTLSLSGGVLKDQIGRTGYIAANEQFQFDNPPQTGAIFTAGWSVCPNMTLALGGSCVFYQCLSGDFYNLYETSQGGQCAAVYIDVLGGASASSTLVSQSSEGQIEATSAPAVSESSEGQIVATSTMTSISIKSDGQPVATTVAVTQISDGQIQATKSAVSEKTDGQPVATSGSAVSEKTDGQPVATSGSAVSEKTDGQPVATSATAVSEKTDGQPVATSATAVSEKTDGQPVATSATAVSEKTDGQPVATSATAVSEKTDGQPVATSATAVSQKSDGQIVATTSATAVSQMSDGQPVATSKGNVTVAATPTTSIVLFTGAAARPTGLGGEFVAFAAGVAAFAFW